MILQQLLGMIQIWQEVKVVSQEFVKNHLVEKNFLKKLEEDLGKKENLEKNQEEKRKVVKDEYPSQQNLEKDP